MQNLDTPEYEKLLEVDVEKEDFHVFSKVLYNTYISKELRWELGVGAPAAVISSEP